MSASTVERVIRTTVHHLGRRKASPRYMQRDGSFPVVFQKAPGDWSLFFTDIFTTLVELRWRTTFLLFALSYVLSWLFFGLCYLLMAHVNGDATGAAPCVTEARTFTGAFLFSVETQATIGFGFRVVTDRCVAAVVVVTVQDVFSCLLDTATIGIIVAKMASARKRAQTVGFSRCAVVNTRNGVLCLSWRLGDFRGNHILEGVARATLVRHAKQPHGSVVLTHQDLQIQDREVALAAPATVIHRLEPGSPLYGVGPDDLPAEDFEVVVSFTYTGDSTGTLHQSRTAYLPTDIRWGQRFREMLKTDGERYRADYALFNETVWTPVPALSAERLERRRRPEPHPAAAGLEFVEEVVMQTWF